MHLSMRANVVGRAQPPLSKHRELPVGQRRTRASGFDFAFITIGNPTTSALGRQGRMQGARSLMAGLQEELIERQARAVHDAAVPPQ